MDNWIEEIFGEEGRIARIGNAQTPPLGYEYRPQQVEMAKLVHQTLSQKGRAVIEAGTGTGKTLAYLIPIVLNKTKTLVSTATKNLQEQIFYRDIPFLKSLGYDVAVAYLKGRSNYLCKLKFTNFKQEPLFRTRKDRTHYANILSWAEITETGDRAELSDLPDVYRTWSDLSTTPDSCLGRKCPFNEKCFVTAARKKAANADIIIVNHHLFFADLAIRAGGHGEVIPDVGAVVFDEAHHLEETASSFFGRNVSIFRFVELTTDYNKAIAELSTIPMELSGLVGKNEACANEFFQQLATKIPNKEKSELAPDLFEDPEIAKGRESVVESLEGLKRCTLATTSLGEAAVTLSRRCAELREDLELILSRAELDWVYMSEYRGRRRSNLFLQAIPIDLSPYFLKLLYPCHRTTVFTSATLAVGGNFSYFRSRIALGPAEQVKELRLDAAFDYMEQSLLYVPEEMPEPSSPDFVERIAPTIETLLKVTDGRAFVLFTSYRNMNGLNELLKDRLPYQLLVQGSRSRDALLQDFRESPHVLLATHSFWEGVDVPGENLSLVIIDKLPFASPFDPLVKARIEYIREQGGNPFRDYQLPQAAISLKQGFGRLIRKRTDRGIVAILDRRLLEKSYGKLFLNTLPRSRRTRDIELVQRWWKRE